MNVRTCTVKYRRRIQEDWGWKRGNMNHKEFVLNNENIRLFREHAGTQVANYSEKLYTIDTRVNQLVATPDFQGQAAENIKAYFKEVYSLILHSLHTVMSDFYNKTNLYNSSAMQKPLCKLYMTACRLRIICTMVSIGQTPNMNKVSSQNHLF